MAQVLSLLERIKLAEYRPGGRGSVCEGGGVFSQGLWLGQPWIGKHLKIIPCPHSSSVHCSLSILLRLLCKEGTVTFFIRKTDHLSSLSLCINIKVYIEFP